MTRRWATGPPAELVILPVLVLVLVGALTPTAELFPHQGDVLLYFQKAESFARGEVPYRDVRFEYPPLALVPMVVPYLAWPFGRPTFEAYQWLFLAWECALLIALVMTLGRIADLVASAGQALTDRADTVRQVGTRTAVLAVVAALPLAWRFDLFPALLTAVALRAALEGRAGTAGAAIGLGILAKVYPLVLLPALVARWLAPVDGRRLAQFGAALGVTVAVGFLPFVLLAGDGAWSFATYQADRGLQLESVGAGLVLLDALARGGAVPLTFGFGAVHVAGPAAETVLAVQPWLSAAAFMGLAGLAVLRSRSELGASGAVNPRTTVALLAASILVLLVTNKVFSVQYVVWLLPFAALLPRGQFAIAAMLMALSIGIHPLNYEGLIAQEAPAVLLLNARNGLALALMLWLAWSLVRRTARVSGDIRSRADAEN